MIKEFQTFEIDYPLVQDDTPTGQRCRVLKAVQISLMMHCLKAFKGAKRKQKLLLCVYAVNQMSPFKVGSAIRKRRK